jgi:hypothetical protein
MGSRHIRNIVKQFATIVMKTVINPKIEYIYDITRFPVFIFVDAHISSAMLICAMSIDRYLNLVYPHWFRSRHEGRKYTLVLVGIWIGGSLFSMLHLVGVGDSELFYQGRGAILISSVIQLEIV